MFDNLNYIAILVSGAIYWVLGGVWYAAVFSKQYQAGLNFNDEEKQKAQKAFPKALATHLLGGLITGTVIAILTRALDATSFVNGMLCGFWPWLGFVLTAQTNQLMFERRHLSLFVIDSCFYLIAFVMMGGILAVWR